MSTPKQRRRSKANPVRRVVVSVDRVTDAAVKAAMKHDGVTYSAAICGLATATALRHPVLEAAIRDVIKESVADRLEREGWTPGLSRMLSRELTGGPPETFKWN